MYLDSIVSLRYEIVIAVSVLLLISIVNFFIKNSRQNLPPGPWGLPLVGYFPFLSKDPYFELTDLAKKYGDVYSLRLGSELVVILNDIKTIKNAFEKPELLGRPPNVWFDVYGIKSVFLENNVNLWQDHRRFVIHSLKDLGVGNSKSEELVQDEINKFQEIFKHRLIDPPLAPSMLNNVTSLVYGKRYDFNDPERKIIDSNLNGMNIIIGQTSKHVYFPSFMRIPFIPKWLGFEKIYKQYMKDQEIFRDSVEEHKKTLDKTHMRDFVDIYLIEMEQKLRKDNKASYSDEVLYGLISGLLTAGYKTLGLTLAWTMFTVAGFPDVQRKIQKEILEVVGTERKPCYMDQKSMPYAHAVLHEVMRWIPVAPLSLMRYTLSDTKVAGYDIPTGTIVMANYWAMHHDPRNWEDPYSFKPERFLTPDGKHVVRPPYFAPFSIGKRACPGENMAYMLLFLYSVSILQKFDVRFPEGFKPTWDEIVNGPLQPSAVKIRFMPKS